VRHKALVRQTKYGGSLIDLRKTGRMVNRIHGKLADEDLRRIVHADHLPGEA